MASDAGLPLVSVITPCLNRAQFIADAIESVLMQDYPHVDHIIMDGASTDGTVDILRCYEGRIRWYSEPDRGQSHCLNKLLRLVEGDIVGWLNSDDFYYPGAISRAVQIFSKDPGLDAIYGCCTLVDVGGRKIGMHAAKLFSLRRLIYYDSGYIPPQAFFLHRRAIERVGDFDESLRYALDYDWLIRLGQTSVVRHVPEIFGAFRRHEDATQNMEFRRAYSRETHQVSRRYGGYQFTHIKWTILEDVPGAGALAAFAAPALKRLVRAHLLPHWL